MHCIILRVRTCHYLAASLRQPPRCAWHRCRLRPPRPLTEHGDRPTDGGTPAPAKATSPSPYLARVPHGLRASRASRSRFSTRLRGYLGSSPPRHGWMYVALALCNTYIGLSRCWDARARELAAAAADNSTVRCPRRLRRRGPPAVSRSLTASTIINTRLSRPAPPE